MAAGVRPEAVFTAPGAPAEVVEQARESGARVHVLAPGVMERVASTVTPQPVMAVVPFVDVPLDRLAGADLLVVCVDVRDPGNAGTVLRSAQAAGADGVIFCGGSVDVYNPKAVRASSGALFHVPAVVGGDAVEVLERIGEWGSTRYGAVPESGLDYVTADLRSPCAFVLGNEAVGLPERVTAVLDERITIPMKGRMESLNVGMVAAVLCFEAARQRRVGAS